MASHGFFDGTMMKNGGFIVPFYGIPWPRQGPHFSTAQPASRVRRWPGTPVGLGSLGGFICFTRWKFLRKGIFITHDKL